MLIRREHTGNVLNLNKKQNNNKKKTKYYHAINYACGHP